jgi:hypothetical protein
MEIINGPNVVPTGACVKISDLKEGLSGLLSGRWWISTT